MPRSVALANSFISITPSDPEDAYQVDADTIILPDEPFQCHSPIPTTPSSYKCLSPLATNITGDTSVDAVSDPPEELQPFQYQCDGVVEEDDGWISDGGDVGGTSTSDSKSSGTMCSYRDVTPALIP